MEREWVTNGLNYALVIEIDFLKPSMRNILCLNSLGFGKDIFECFSKIGLLLT